MNLNATMKLDIEAQKSRQVYQIALVDTSFTPAMGYMLVVQQRDDATLLPIIQAHMAPGTIIHSDQWAAYNNVQSIVLSDSKPLRRVYEQNYRMWKMSTRVVALFT